MVDYAAPLFQHPPENWDEKKCRKLANSVAKDGLGTPYPFKGYVTFGHPVHGLTARYNGGTYVNGVWYQGEQWSLPTLPSGFKLVKVPTWGWRLVQTTGESS